MTVRRTAVLVALLLAAPLPALTPATAAAPGPIAAARAVPAPEWDALFDRSRGWTGADGIYSIPLSGDERPGSADATTTFFTFSDTFIGRVNGADERVGGSTLVNNTNALLAGGQPVPSQIDFSWRTRANGDPFAQVVPPQTGPVRTWFWPNDGVVVGDRLYLYSLRMREGGSGAFAFEVDGISLLSTVASARPAFGRYTQTDAPLYLPASDTADALPSAEAASDTADALPSAEAASDTADALPSAEAAGVQGETTYGLAVLPNTAEAGAPAADGYLYVYGLRNDRLNKRLVVARVRPDQIADFAAYRFFDGRSWSPDIAAAKPVTTRLSSEFSVSPLADGRYVLVFMLDGLSNQVAVRYADSPVGPWSDYQVVYRAPEDNLTPNTYTYNAKAHPHLSDPDRLLISYNVNTFDFFENFSQADIYRPRFVWLPLD